MVRNTGSRFLRGVLGCRWVCSLVCGLVCGLVLASAAAWAQPLPLIKLSDLRLSAGQPLTVTASGLEPGTSYTLNLTNENGEVTQDEAEVRADAQGDFSYTTRLDTPGRWRLNVQGSTLDARFEVEVTSRDPTAPAVDPPAVPGETAPTEAPSLETAPIEPAPDPSETLPTESVPIEPAPDEPETPPSDSPALGTPEGAPEEQAEPPALNVPPAPTPGETAAQDDARDDLQDGATLERTPLEPDAAPNELSPPTAPPQPSVPFEVALEDGAVVARGGDEVFWTFAFPPDSGETRALLVRPEAVYVGHGNSLLALDPATGVVRDRLALPSRVMGLLATADGLTVTTETAELELSEEELSEVEVSGGLQTTLPFAPEPALFGLVRAEAAVADPATRLAQDPTNPWLYLQVGERQDDPERALEAFTEAVNRAETFYDAAGVSRALVDLGQPDLANEAFDKALRDFAERGYDPRLLRDPALHEAYHFPLEPFRTALAAGDLERAGFWAPWLAHFATPDVPEVGRALHDYAGALRQNGAAAEADRWRTLGQGRPGLPTLAVAARFLGRSGWYGALALLVTALALHLTLAAKYWRAQSVNFERRRLLKRSVSPLSRLFIMRFYSLTEKLVLFFLLAGALLLAGLAAGYREAGDVAALGAGTFENAAAQAYLAEAPLAGPRGDFTQGYAAQVAAVGAPDTARARYEAAGNFAPALNNLGALSGDDTFYRRAAELARLPEARYNLGDPDTDFPFQRTYRPGEPLLAVPSAQDVQVALAGDWSRSIAAVFANPWAGLQAARPAGLSPTLWTPLVVLFLVLAAVTLLWLFIPRLRWVRNAPRGWLYHLLALLVPGSGLADEMWGLLLLVPWALFGLDTLSHLYAWDIGLGLSLRTDLVVLAVVYLVNTVAVAVEFWSYRRRMAVLKRENPELALEFGLIRPARVRRLG